MKYKYAALPDDRTVVIVLNPRTSKPLHPQEIYGD